MGLYLVQIDFEGTVGCLFLCLEEVAACEN